MRDDGDGYMAIERVTLRDGRVFSLGANGLRLICRVNEPIPPIGRYLKSMILLPPAVHADWATGSSALNQAGSKTSLATTP
jgi:hypothetical protein